jgi:hypothetical protein
VPRLQATRCRLARSHRLIATCLLLTLPGCGGKVGEGASGNAIYTETDLRKMPFIMGFRDALGKPCRVVEQTISIGGHKAQATSTMCQQPDGRWILEEAR